MEVTDVRDILKRIIPFLITALIVWWLYSTYGALEYTISNFHEFFRLIWEHILLVIISLSAAVAVGILLGVLMTRSGLENISGAIMSMVNIWQSVPSLGVIALAYGILPNLGLSGIGVLPALIALFVHAVAPVVRNTYTGIESINRNIIEAADGMGMTCNQILFKIEFPNALPVIMGGIRTATAIIVGTAPLAFLIGGGGLGFWIFTGISLMDMGIMMAGAVPVALMAMIFDLVLGCVENIVVSDGIQAEVYSAM